MTINGEQVETNNRFQLIKTKSEKFKIDYIKAMMDSFETKYDLDIPLGQVLRIFYCFRACTHRFSNVFGKTI